MSKKIILNEKQIDKYIVDTLALSDQPITAFEKEHGVSLCDVVSEDEIYTLKRNPDYDRLVPNSSPYIRDRRVCGQLRVKDGRKLRCLMAAGFGTNRDGWGRCRVHDRKRTGHRALNLLKLCRAEGLALGYKELIECAPGVFDDTKFGEIEEEIVVLTLLLQEELNQPKELVSKKDVVEIVKALGGIKVARQKIKNDKLLIDVNSVKLFVSGIMDVLRRFLPPSQYSMVVDELEKTPFPINSPMQKLIGKDDDKVV